MRDRMTPIRGASVFKRAMSGIYTIAVKLTGSCLRFTWGRWRFLPRIEECDSFGFVLRQIR